MPKPAKCPQCGTTLPPGALDGLCPACLLEHGARAETATPAEAEPFQPPSVAEVARLFPQLEILAFIGKGGMGAVYKARQPSLDRFVALKILPSQTASGPGFAERFNREARALARLSHPNIVAVHEFGQANGLPFFIMEFVDGLNLRQLEQAGKLSPREALQIVPQICEALQFAHDEGIVHRDIKPENILLDKKGRVKIADFGIARIMGGSATLTPSLPHPMGGGRAQGEGRPPITEEGKVIGTPHYMAPEQVENPQAVDHRADIYSLGVVFYEMLTGELPLGKFAPPSRKVQVDVRLDEVVLHALEKKPERRYQQASHVKTDVETIASGIPANDPRESKPGLLADRNRIRAGLLILALMAVIALITATQYRQSRPAGIAVVFTGYSTSAAPVQITGIQRTPQAALPIRVTLPAGSQFAQFSVPNTSESAFTLYQPYRIETQMAGSWQELSRGMFDSNQVVAPRSSASLLIPAPTNQLPWRVAVQYLHQGTLRSRLEGGPGSWRLWCASEKIEPEKSRLSFGPAIERMMQNKTETDLCLIDLDRDKVFDRALNKVFAQDHSGREAWLAWRNQQGIDAVALIRGETQGLVGWDMRVVPVAPHSWDITPAALAGQLSSVQPLPETDIRGNHALPATFLFQTREGGTGILQITGFSDDPRGMKFRYKLAQNSANQAAEPQAISEAELADEPTRLRFLAWQDEWMHDEWKKEDQPGRAWHPDGSAVTDKTELRLLRAVLHPRLYPGKGNPRFLLLWFSHPLFDRHSASEVALLDGAGQPIPLRGSAYGLRAADADHDNVGWIAATLGVGEGDQIPRTATIRLHYTVGPLERQRQIASFQFNIRTGVSLEGDGELNGIGQDADGKTFVAIAIDAQKSAGRRFGIIAVTRDGRQLESSPSMASAGATVGIARFEFEVPLADVAQFRVGTRPVRTMEWKDVTLYRELPPPRPIGTNACVARWPQGRMELVALSDHPSTNQHWWRPDGLPAADLNFEPTMRVLSHVEGLCWEFVIRHEGFPPESSTAFEFKPAAISISQDPWPNQKGKRLPDHEIVIAILPADLPSVTLRAGLAAGPWQTLAKREPQAGTTSGRFQHEGQEWDVLFHDPVEIGAETHLTASHSMVKGWETRIAAVDLKGGQHLGRRSHGAVAALARTTARFDKLHLAQIKEFQFQVRPYRWAEFRNVSLQAGHRTNVEVRDADVTGSE